MPANVGQEHNKICSMNMTNYYLLKADVSFCSQAKTAAMLIQSLSCAFRLQAGQVTQHDK